MTKVLKATKVDQGPKVTPDHRDRKATKVLKVIPGQEVLKVTKVTLVPADYPTLDLQCRGILI